MAGSVACVYLVGCIVMSATDSIALMLMDLTPERFAPFGDVIAMRNDCMEKMNAARFDRFVDLAAVDVDGGCAAVNLSLMRCVITSGLPYQIELLERHPRGSQAFFPTSGHDYVVAVAPPAEQPDPHALVAFRVRGDQGINLRRGVWHLPMLGFVRHQSFLVVDRKGDGNCDEFALTTPVTLRGSL